MTNRITTLFLLLGILNVADCITTVYAVQLGIQEVNPIMSSIVTSSEFIPFKLSASALFVAVGIISSRMWTMLSDRLRRIIRTLLVAIVLFYAFVVVNNLFWILLTLVC